MTDPRIIKALIEQEMDEANRTHPLFQSTHEAYAVIKEELEETKEALLTCEGLLNDMWHRVRNDWEVESILKLLKTYSGEVAREAIQAGAMAQKALESKIHTK